MCVFCSLSRGFLGWVGSLTFGLRITWKQPEIVWHWNGGSNPGASQDRGWWCKSTSSRILVNPGRIQEVGLLIFWLAMLPIDREGSRWRPVKWVVWKTLGKSSIWSSIVDVKTLSGKGHSLAEVIRPVEVCFQRCRVGVLIYLGFPLVTYEHWTHNHLSCEKI